jgi:serine protease
MSQETPKAPNQDADRQIEAFPPHKPRVVVKFKNSIQLPYEESVERLFDPENQQAWKRIVTSFPGITLKRVFTSLPPEKIRALGARAAQADRTYRPKNFLSYFAIEYSLNTNPRELVSALLNWKAVQTAYLEGTPAPPPATNPVNDPRFHFQDYLDPAPNGIDARAAWTRSGGDGSGMQFVDVEQGWRLSHTDLPPAITELEGHNRIPHRSHGTSVLGILVAVDNINFHVGIAHKAIPSVISEWRPDNSYNTADAVLTALPELRFGDVLLLETQYYVGSQLLPVEWQLAVREAIETCVAAGVVVIEAAGNEGINLGTLPWENSGAIMVAGASAAIPHRRIHISNFGPRINCYAWGESVDTLSTDLPGFTRTFGGTSSASAIVAGAALAVQGIARNDFGRCYRPRELRAILSHPGWGTPSENPAVDQIGVMPNLATIIAKLSPPAPSPVLI